MTQWLVQLKGEEEDLKVLSKIFRSPNLNVRRDEDGYYYLRSPDIASIDDESARYERATELVRNTNVAARLALGDNYFAVEFDGMARIEDDGQRYRSVTKSVHTSWHVRTFYNDASPEEVGRLVAVLDDQELLKVIDLFAQSLDWKDDRFKRFLYGWKALEVFISKVFGRYRRDLITGNVYIPAMSKHLERIAKAVKTDKYPLLDKFGVIACVLADRSSNSGIVELDSDVDTFQRLKDFRDALFHRPDVAEATLPTLTVELQSLLSKYLRRHLECTQ